MLQMGTPVDGIGMDTLDLSDAVVRHCRLLLSGKEGLHHKPKILERNTVVSSVSLLTSWNSGRDAAEMYAQQSGIVLDPLE